MLCYSSRCRYCFSEEEGFLVGGHPTPRARRIWWWAWVSLKDFFYLPLKYKKKKKKSIVHSALMFILFICHLGHYSSTSHTLDRSTFSSFPYVFINLFYCFYLHLSCFFFLISIPLLAYSYLVFSSSLYYYKRKSRNYNNK